MITQDTGSRYRPQYCVRYEDYLKQQRAFVQLRLPTPLTVQKVRSAEAARKAAELVAEMEAA